MSKNNMNTDDPVLAFLSGKGPNPIPAEKRARGPATKRFLAEVDEEIARQDRENARRPEPSVEDEIAAVMRLVKDNELMISLLRNKEALSMSQLAAKLGKELPNVSRTVSRMAAYGLVGFEAKGDGRSKAPVWRLEQFELQGGMGWLHAYCLIRLMESDKQVEPEAFSSFAEEMERFASTALKKAKSFVARKSPVAAKA